MISLKGVTKEYDNIPVVNNLSLEVGRGEFCVLIGLSGCGKSTTLKMMNRLVEPTRGEIRISDDPISSWRPELLRRRIGYVIQDIGLFPHWTVEQNISVVPKLLKWKSRRMRDRVTELLELFNLREDAFRNKYPDQLSGGQAQRVGVARALASDPDLLLMDEPFGALDPITRETLQLELARVQREFKKTIVFVTHDINEAFRLASRIVVMNSGECVQYDTPEAILDRPANRFVHDFIGTDRGLRRLSRLTVDGAIKAARSVSASDSMDLARKLARESKTVWITDQKGRLLGWLGDLSDSRNNDDLSDHLVRVDSDFPLHRTSLMKEAVSRMLWQSIQCVPVVDDDNRLIGEIRFQDVLDSKEAGT